MRIAIVAGIKIPVPPIAYGGSERVLHDLIEGLVKLGHEVYLFANKNSKTSATLIPYPDNIKVDDILDFVMNNLPDNIDIIHDNTEYLIYEYTHNKEKVKNLPVCFTLHYASRWDYEHENTIYPSYYMKNLLSEKSNPNSYVIPHCIDVNDYIYKEEKKDYLLYMGIIKYNKNTHKAIELAEKYNFELILAGPQDSDDPDLIYFHNEIEPHLNDHIKYIGEVKGQERLDLFSNAKALIFPTRIETFGLVAVEAMASGTPPLYLNTCTGKEITKELSDKLVFDTIDEMAISIFKKDWPEPKVLREFVKKNYNIDSVSKKYSELYDTLIKKEKKMERAKNSISLCLISKNEEKNIANCIESVYGIVDEIILVDTGSTDRTKEIASKYTDKIFDFEWIYDFSAARNYAKSFATSEYVFFLDCDDIFKPEDRQKFKELKESMDGSKDLYWMYYDYRHDEFGNSNYSFLTERIFRNVPEVKWTGVIHEMLLLGDMYNNAVKTDIRITHTSNHDNTDTYMKYFKINRDKGHVFTQREKFFFSMELFKHQEYDECLSLAEDVMNDKNYYNAYEQSSAFSMAANIHKDRGEYKDAIECFLRASYIHQPLPYNYYSVAECYRALGKFDHALFYYNSILAEGVFFREKFINESVYTNFDNDLLYYRIKSLLSLIMIYYNDLHDVAKSEEANNKLLELDPTNESGLFNKKFFDSLKGE